MSCNICFEEKVEIKCYECEYESCKGCLSKYFFVRNNFVCLSCNTEFSGKFVIDSYGISFYNKFINQSFEIIFKNENALLRQTNIKADFKRDEPFSDLTKREFSECSNLLRIVLPNRLYTYDLCPLCSNKMYNNFCTTCDKNICVRCKNPKEAKHVCSNEEIGNADFIASNTKQCPKCLTRISKSEGCDQMWCVKCRTTFSWRTNEILTERIHNPHYYEYTKDVSQESGVFRNQELNLTFVTIDGDSHHISNEEQLSILDYIDLLDEYSNNLRPGDNFERLRIKYINEDISRESWKITLYRWIRRSYFYKDLIRLIQEFKTQTLRKVIKKENNLEMNSFNERFFSLFRTYGYISKVPLFSKTLDETDNRLINYPYSFRYSSEY